MRQKRSLYNLLSDCTVRIKIKDKQQTGTGFFIAPGTILTCAHVVASAYTGNLPVETTYNDQTHTAKPINSTDIFSDRYPDLALLRINFRDHPCASMGDGAEVFDRLYSFGYTSD